MPQKVWAIGEEVLAADFNPYVQQQTVPQFTNTAQRDAQWAAPPVGALCVTQDTLTQWIWTGTAWQQVSGARFLGTWACTANTGSTGAAVVVTGLSQSITVGPGTRKLRIDFHAQYQNDTANNTARYQVRLDTSTVAPQSVMMGSALTGGPSGLAGGASALFQGVAAGAHTIDMTVTRYTGTGTAFAIAGGTTLTAWDIGI